MIYTPMTCRAMRLAYAAHHGQTDKAGLPYIFHPLHLAEQMDDEITVCVALLHDVAEDTAVTLDALAQAFPPAVVGPLRLLTRAPGTPYLDYVRALAGDPVARTVKLADLAHNLDQSRLAGCPDAVRQRAAARRQTYEQARRLLLRAERQKQEPPGSE